MFAMNRCDYRVSSAMKRLMMVFTLFAAPAAAQTADSTGGESAPPIQDNSFLVEEAYNQEAGVVQHIVTFYRPTRQKDFEIGFAQEWPIGSIRHQLSFDLPLLRQSSTTGVGDIGINYRNQLVGDGTTRLAVSPRLSLLLPTGDWRNSRGNGATGLEVNLPVSYVLSPHVVTHLNAGASYVPSARNPIGDRANISEWSVGQSLILTTSRAIQPMLEAVFSRGQEVTGDDRAEWSNTTLIAPGVRGAFNFPSGLQIVPGISVPIGIGSSREYRGIFLYLSVEHGF